MIVDEQAATRLLQRLEQQDEKALVELHRLFARRIYAFALNRVNDCDAAESIVSDTLFEVWKNPGRFRGESKVSTWILGIAHYKALTVWRQKGVVHEDIAEHIDSVEDGAALADELMEMQQDRERLDYCIQRLQSMHKECVFLAYYEEWGVGEIAELQRVPENTVKTRLFHARKQLRECLGRLLMRR